MALDDYHAGPKRRKRLDRIDEDTVHQQAVQYISLRYRDTPLRTDYAAGLGLNKVQARKHVCRVIPEPGQTYKWRSPPSCTTAYLSS